MNLILSDDNSIMVYVGILTIVLNEMLFDLLRMKMNVRKKKLKKINNLKIYNYEQNIHVLY